MTGAVGAAGAIGAAGAVGAVGVQPQAKARETATDPSKRVGIFMSGFLCGAVMIRARWPLYCVDWAAEHAVVPGVPHAACIRWLRP